MGTLIAVITIIGLMIVYLIQQDNMHIPDEEVRSECCGSSIIMGTDLCKDCKEHTGIHNN